MDRHLVNNLPTSQDQLDLMFTELCGVTSLTELAILMPLVNTASAEENYLTDGLSKIEPGKLVRGLAGVRSIKLRETGLTVEQINLLMAKVIRSLDLIDKNLSQADVETMIAAFNSLESLSLHYGTLIGATNMASFLAAMGSSPSSLKELSLRNISLSHVEAGTLGRAVRGLTSLEIMISDLTPAQQEAVFTTFCRRPAGPRLDHLCLSHNDLSQLSPLLFVEVCKHVKCLEIFNSKVTKAQMEGLFEAVSSKSPLRELNVNYNDLSQVSSTTMARGLNNLHKVFMYKTELTEGQVEAILDYGMRESRLYHLDIRYNIRPNSSCHLTKYLRSHVYKIEL